MNFRWQRPTPGRDERIGIDGVRGWTIEPVRTSLLAAAGRTARRAMRQLGGTRLRTPDPDRCSIRVVWTVAVLSLIFVLALAQVPRVAPTAFALLPTGPAATMAPASGPAVGQVADPGAAATVAGAETAPAAVRALAVPIEAGADPTAEPSAGGGLEPAATAATPVAPVSSSQPAAETTGAPAATGSPTPAATSAPPTAAPVVTTTTTSTTTTTTSTSGGKTTTKTTTTTTSTRTR